MLCLAHDKLLGRVDEVSTALLEDVPQPREHAVNMAHSEAHATCAPAHTALAHALLRHTKLMLLLSSKHHLRCKMCEDASSALLCPLSAAAACLAEWAACLNRAWCLSCSCVTANTALQLFGPVEAPMYSLQYAGGGEIPSEATSGSKVLAVQRLSTLLDACMVSSLTQGR